MISIKANFIPRGATCYGRSNGKLLSFEALGSYTVKSPEDEYVDARTFTTDGSMLVNPDDFSEEVLLNMLVNMFSWGPVVKVHLVGEYQIVEFHPQIFEGCRATGKYSDETNFHPYLNWKDTNTTYDSLDFALAGVIALKHDGLNSQAANYFMRMLQPWSNDK